MKIGTWNWSEARTECNNLHPLSHPVVLNDVTDALVFSFFCQTESKSEFILFNLKIITQILKYLNMI